MFLQKKGPVDIRVPPTDNGRLEAILEAHGISSSVMINNLQDLIDDEAKAMGKARAADNKQNHNMDKHWSQNIAKTVDLLFCQPCSHFCHIHLQRFKKFFHWFINQVCFSLAKKFQCSLFRCSK